MARVVVDYWEVRDEHDHPLDLLRIIQLASAVPVDQRIRDRGRSHADVLVEAEVQGNEAWGLVVRARKENIPGVINMRTGQIGSLPLRPGETVGEQMSFRYNSALRILVTQRNPIVRSTALEYLLFDVTKVDFYLQMVLREDAWDRLDRIETIGRLDIKFEGPRHHPDFSREIPSLNQLLDEASEAASAESVELILSCGRRRGAALDRAIVGRIVNHFRGREGREAKKLSIRGRDPETGRSEVVDFIRDRLVQTGEVEYEGGQLDRHQCQQLLRQAIEQNQAYLRRLRGA